MSLSPSSTSPSSLSSPLSLSPHTATAATSATAATTTATTISKDILDPPDTPQLREAIDLCFQLCKDMVQLKSQRMVLDQDKYNTYYDHISNNANHLLDSLRHMEEKPMYSDGIGEEAPAPVSTPTKEGSDYSLIRQIRNLNGTAQTKYRRRSKRNMIGQRCHSCNTTNTPEWRRGPDGARTLCNACGLHYSKLLRKGSFMVQSRHAKLTENSTISIEFDDTVCAEDIQS
ncbi:GATA zinc finger-domain-containing protein [Spinellus fusiger]|nr:GATA zinc finger-domain-containing protein [Spinellus fusiger]